MLPAFTHLIKTRWHTFKTVHPLAKGMVSYAILWPTASIVQQTIEGKNLDNYNWACAARFGIFGTLYVAPTIYCWVRLSAAMWPQMNLRVALIKAAVEQFSYGPFACASFFFGMSLLEMKGLKAACEEVNAKFFPTLKVGMCVWPILQTINFSMVPEHNRVVFVSVCSFLWTIFVAFVKQMDID